MTKDNNLDELLKIVEGHEDIKIEVTVDKSVNQFIQDNNITNGDIFIPSFFLYEAYIDWLPQNDKLSKPAFFQYFGRIFQSINRKQTRGYMLNMDVDMSASRYWRLKQREKRRKASKIGVKKRKKPKKEEKKTT